MGERLPGLRASAMIRVLKQLGFELARQRGSHSFWHHPDGRATVVPIHRGEDLGRGLLRQIIRDIELTPNEFLDQLRRKFRRK